MVEWIVKLVLFVAGVWGLTWLAQDYLVFLPRQAGAPARLPEQAQALELTTADGPRIRGWRIPARTPAASGRAAPTLVYFGGNAEDVSWTLADPRWPEDWAIVGFNYRGYGASEGKPGERALVEDAHAIYDQLVRRDDVDASRIVACGRSLGSGVAVALAAARPVAAVVLISPFDSLVAVGRHHYPYLPVSLLLRHRFDALAQARALGVPMHAIVAQNDSIIPVARSRALHEAWAGPKNWQVVAQADHNTVSESNAYWEGIGEFLDGVARRTRLIE